MEFFASLRRKGVWPETFWEVDAMVKGRICELWREGDPLGHAGDLLSGLQHFRSYLKTRLPSGWRFFQGWKRKELPRRAPPMRRSVALAFAGVLWKAGLPGAAATVLLAFHCILRTGEFLRIRWKDIHMGRDDRGVLSLGETKSRRIEAVSIDDRALGRILRLLRGAPGELLVSMSEGQFRYTFRAVRDFLLLRDSDLLPYSLRRGGACYDFRDHGLFSKIAVRGRWESERSCRVYVHEGLVQMSSLNYSDAARARVARYSLANVLRW
jgi:integrase